MNVKNVLVDDFNSTMLLILNKVKQRQFFYINLLEVHSLLR